MSPNQLTSIAVAVVRHADWVLIGKRPAGVPLAGLWEFPGGKVADGETPSQAAARECLEETGLTVQVGDRNLEVVYPYPHGRLKIEFYAASLVDSAHFGNQPRHPFRWVKIGDLTRYRFPPANAAMIARLAQTLPDGS